MIKHEKSQEKSTEALLANRNWNPMHLQTRMTYDKWLQKGDNILCPLNSDFSTECGKNIWSTMTYMSALELQIFQVQQ